MCCSISAEVGEIRAWVDFGLGLRTRILPLSLKLIQSVFEGAGLY